MNAIKLLFAATSYPRVPLRMDTASSIDEGFWEKYRCRNLSDAIKKPVGGLIISLTTK